MSCVVGSLVVAYKLYKNKKKNKMKIKEKPIKEFRRLNINSQSFSFKQCNKLAFI